MLTLILMMMVSTASAYDFISGKIAYSITSQSEKTVSVVPIHADITYGDLVIPEKVTYNMNEYTVTAIGDDAFRETGQTITSLTLPNTIKKIGAHAFIGSNITALHIPNSVTTIGNGAFSTCNYLKNVYIGNSVTEIGVSAFWYCLDLENVNFGNSIKTIGHHAFQECRLLKNIRIPNSVTTIGDYCNVSLI